MLLIFTSWTNSMHNTTAQQAYINEIKLSPIFPETEYLPIVINIM